MSTPRPAIWLIPFGVASLPVSAVAPYFVVAAIVHIGAVATRFDGLAVAPAIQLAIMVAQFPLLVLSGYFEGRLDHGASMAGMPRWMQIRSRAVKLAFAFAMIYIAVVAAQTWDVSIGPLDPTPPKAWPMAQRAAWFAMFTGGMLFPFYLLAASVLIPVLRAMTAPLRALPALAGGVLALAVGGALGMAVMSAVTSTRIGAFASQVKATFKAHPALSVAVIASTTLGPLLLGLVLGRKKRG
jgi:hypothetical protein